MAFIDIIVIILILAFVVTRFLSHNLPEETKEERKKAKEKQKKMGMVVPFPDMEDLPKPSKKKMRTVKSMDELEGIEQVKTIDTDFKEKDFVEGAKYAYNMFYDALNDVDEETLDDLTAPRLFDRYMEKVESLESEGKQQRFEVKNIISAEIVDAKVHGQTAIIDVKYKAEHVEYVVDSEENIVEGDDEKIKTVDTVWTWARNVNETDPNWELEDIAALA